LTSSLDPRVGHALVCTRAQGLAVPLPNWYCRNRRRARTKKVLGNGVPQPLPKGSPIGQPSEIREAHAAHRRRDRRQHRLNLHRVRDFLDFAAGGSIANTADWLDQLHCSRSCATSGAAWTGTNRMGRPSVIAFVRWESRKSLLSRDHSPKVPSPQRLRANGEPADYACHVGTQQPICALELCFGKRGSSWGSRVAK